MSFSKLAICDNRFHYCHMYRDSELLVVYAIHQTALCELRTGSKEMRLTLCVLNYFFIGPCMVDIQFWNKILMRVLEIIGKLNQKTSSQLLPYCWSSIPCLMLFYNGINFSFNQLLQFLASQFAEFPMFPEFSHFSLQKKLLKTLMGPVN